ncbi:allatostatin-A receptor [Lingula anatina]|uniref:Allatostatin-A receptor n=1 Tax=Lingula anatina TaxID=7574 RepID=A0A1S3IF10_LINAN|nr:allatostatin-A receptor [Lingula anatina]XP_013396728.1 allatostatin-A receptor [Lingula anatina]|eukprot:XP_013396727.1 allatostatin-A receptor [Lingula anatina]
MMHETKANFSSNSTHDPVMTDDNDTAEFMLALHTASIAFPVVMCIIWIVGLFGNITVIYVIKTHRSPFSCPNILFLNLAVSDLLFLVICLPLYSALYISEFTIELGDFGCKLLFYVLYVTLGAGIFTMVTISAFRYFVIKLPLKSSKHLTGAHALFSTSLIWLFVFAINIPIALFHGEYHRGDKIQCTILVDNDSEFHLLIFLMTGIDFFIPIFLTGLFSILMIIEVKKNRQLIPTAKRNGGNLECPCDHASRRSIRNKTGETSRLLIVVLAVTLVFVFCWGPTQILFLCSANGVSIGSPKDIIIITMITYCIAFANSAVNPFIYHFMSKEFKKSLRKIICRGKEARKEISIEYSMVSHDSLVINSRIKRQWERRSPGKDISIGMSTRSTSVSPRVSRDERVSFA